MSRYTGPMQKRKRRFGLLPDSSTGHDGRGRRRKSDYGIRLEEKQKLRFIYGIQEKQFRRYFQQATKEPENTGLVLLQSLERRLDNVVYRLGFATTRAAARQLVNHGHVTVNEGKVDVPSYNIKEGDVVTLKLGSLEIPTVKESLETRKDENLPSWLEHKGPVGRIKSLPAPDDLRTDIDLQLIIEYYSR